MAEAFWTLPPASQHTPGPWEARGCELVGESTLLATIHWHSGRQEQNNADTALMEAGPDMLAALIAIEAAFTNPYDNAPYEDGEIAELDAVRAAISKASGVPLPATLAALHPVDSRAQGGEK